MRLSNNKRTILLIIAIIILLYILFVFWFGYGFCIWLEGKANHRSDDIISIPFAYDQVIDMMCLGTLGTYLLWVSSSILIVKRSFKWWRVSATICYIIGLVCVLRVIIPLAVYGFHIRDYNMYIIGSGFLATFFFFASSSIYLYRKSFKYKKTITEIFYILGMIIISPIVIVCGVGGITGFIRLICSLYY